MASSGRLYRKGITLLQLAEKFPDEEFAQKWFETDCHPDRELRCPASG